MVHFVSYKKKQREYMVGLCDEIAVFPPLLMCKYRLMFY